MAKNKIEYNNVKKVNTVRELTEIALAESPDKTAYKYRADGEIKSVTYFGFMKRVYGIGEFLHSKGLNGSNYACIGSNSFKWITAYFAGLLSKGAFVPIDRELPEKDYIHLLDDCCCKVVFYDERFEAALRAHRDELKNIELFIGFDRTEDDGEFLSYRNVVHAGREMGTTEFLEGERDLDSMKLLVYTSGTTGMSKGVMLTERNIMTSTCNALTVATLYTNALSILPYNHTYESVSDILTAFYNHATLCINDSLTAIVRNLKIYRPDYMLVVPAVADMFYKRIIRDLKAKNMEEQFEKMIAKSHNLRKMGIDKRKEIFSFIHDIFGGNMIEIICGGAPLRPEVGEFFDNIGIPLINGYGITECSPLVSVNQTSDNDYRTAGIRLPCLEWKIDEPNSEGIGEIMVKGDVVMKGYYNRPDLTAEVLKDGWFSTGDYGRITEDDRLVIAGRKKNIIVLSNGKNIYPEEIEGYIQNIDYVNEVIVAGDFDDEGNESSLLAEVYLNEKKTPSQVLKSIRTACKELPVYKQISRVIIRDDEFEKTTTNKIKRNTKSKKDDDKK